ncbi:FtsX-like permease family protein [Rhizobiales bacterium]|uniref:ABC transporter permease n=1 Tax=Hongsoonwoonella zoysiae TaxID=2821844 RepID=UPI00155F6FA9|nr:FtsX-like permease family protein [Hongsoonwoonella zoysiae]NRG17525.1 FtsX-like permease family protein [Hongsoonwoonella zoysiae]
MRMLDRKLTRDLLRLWAQALAVAMVMACGVMTIIIAVGAWRSLEETRSAFYDRYRFASVFATATRAPRTLKARIENIPGVAAAELRTVHYTLLDVEGMPEPATGIAVSLPEFGEPEANRVYIRKGRLPEPARTSEVAVTETFANAHGLVPGNSFSALLNGRKRELTITGIVLSPEYIYAIGPGDMVPDPRRFGVLYMPGKVLEGIFDMEGAFNDVAITTLRHANTDRIIEQLDDILKPYGGTGAYDREDQMSHAFLDSELTSLKAMAMVIPPIFLFISAFLVNMILSRLIALEREQIGLLKAVGYGNLDVGWHYAKLVIVISMVGLAIGSIFGTWLGRGLTELYARFYSFPFLIFRQTLDLYLIAGGITAGAALSGAAKAIWATVSLPPAVAMRPPAPTRYRSIFLARLQEVRIFSQLTVMALRHLIRWPVRSALTTLGTALSVALLVTALFSYDSIDFMIDAIFFRADRQDATLTFNNEQGPSALQSVAALPGVLKAEGFRTTPVMLRNGHRERRAAITGLPDSPDLSRILDLDLNPVPPVPVGLLLSERVADILHVRVGDMLEVELQEKDDRVVELPVTGVIQSYVGLSVFMSLEALNRVMMDGERISGARVLIDNNRLDELYAQIKATPELGSIALQGVSRKLFRETVEENITIMTTLYVALAVIITFGVIYNSARIQLSERARELASLRVFGFTRAEVSGVLLIELGVIVFVAQPLGWGLGYGFSWSVVQGFESDLFRIPLIVSSETFAVSSLVVLGAAVISALIVRRRVDRLDLVRVLKTRE